MCKKLIPLKGLFSITALLSGGTKSETQNESAMRPRPHIHISLCNSLHVYTNKTTSARVIKFCRV